jgi:rare lipoprotein A
MLKLIFSVLLALGMLLSTPTYSTAAENGVASWYGHPYHGRKTASGERYNMWAFTAAHRTLPFGTKLRVTYKGRSVIVRVNDRGPFIKGRSLDLSRAAADAIGCTAVGICRVTMEKL